MKIWLTLSLILLLSACSTRPVTQKAALYRAPSVPIQPETLALENRILLRNAGLEPDLQKIVPTLRDAELARMLTYVAVYHRHWNNAWLALERWWKLTGANEERIELNIRLLAMLGDVQGAALLLQDYLQWRNIEDPELWVDVGNMLLFRIEPEIGLAVWDALPALVMPKSEASLRRYRGALLAFRYKAEEVGANFRRQADAVDAAYALARMTDKPADWDMTYTLAQKYQREAIQLEAMKNWYRVEPDNRDLAYALASTLREQGETMEAVKVLDRREQDPLAIYSAISFLLDQGLRQAAEQRFARLEQLPDEVEGKAFYTAIAAEIMGDDATAMHWYRQARGSYRPRALMQLAILMADHGQEVRAMQLLEKLRKEPGIDAQRLARVGAQLAIQLNRPEEALAWFDSVQPEGQEGKLLRYDKAMFLLEQQQVDAAVALFRQLAEENPEEWELVNAYAYTLVDYTDRLEEAEPLLLKVVEADPDNAAFLDSLGWLRYRQGKLEAALQILEKAWKLDPDPEIAAHLGEVLWKLGQRERARQVWNQAREKHPKNRTLARTVQRFVR